MGFVHDDDGLARAVETAFGYDDVVVLERFIRGRELTVGLLGGGPLPPVEITAPGGVYDYEAKYASRATMYVCPAELDEAVSGRRSALAVDVFRALRGRGAARVDFRLDPSGGPYVLEMNTIPGMTAASLLPKAAAAAGIGFTQLVETILEDALGEEKG